jgi:hypothetical protein
MDKMREMRQKRGEMGQLRDTKVKETGKLRRGYA